MRQATRRFLKIKQSSACWIQTVKHTPREWAQPSKCYDNAVREQKERGTTVVSGWLVGEYRLDVDASPVFFHFWNVDVDGNHYDTTPSPTGHSQTYEYIADSDVFDGARKYAKTNGTELVGPPSFKILSRGIQIAIHEHKTDNFVWKTVPEQAMTVVDMLTAQSAERQHNSGLTPC